MFFISYILILEQHGFVSRNIFSEYDIEFLFCSYMQILRYIVYDPRTLIRVYSLWRESKLFFICWDLINLFFNILYTRKIKKINEIKTKIKFQLVELYVARCHCEVDAEEAVFISRAPPSPFVQILFGYII